MKYLSPSVKETAFNCPHCGALAKQFWSSVYLIANDGNMLIPYVVDEQVMANIDLNKIMDGDEREKRRKWLDRMLVGTLFVEVADNARYSDKKLRNCNISSCYNCGEFCVWIHDKLMYPAFGCVVVANPDMPEDIRRDYDEAGAILDKSPRGAAALLRLAIQKLCKELGQPGKNINEDIKGLVAKGLDVRVQQALDAVRVIGNSAVHPGKIDLRDDRATAESLFKLLNLIVDKTISEPKHVKEVYDMLPKHLLDEIAKRDAPKS